MFKVNQQIRIKTGAELQADGHEKSASGNYYSVRYNFLKEMEERLSGKQFKIKSVSAEGDLIKLHGDEDKFSISPEMIAEEMFKVGDKVRIMPLAKMEELYEKDSEGDFEIIVNGQCQAFFVEEMEDLCGKEYTIESIDELDGECDLTPYVRGWTITTGMLELVERKFAEEEIEEEVEEIEEEVEEIEESETFKTGDVVRVKTIDELNAFREENHRQVMFGWNEDMNHLCGEMFVIKGISPTGHVSGLNTMWSISTDMLVKLSATDVFAKLEELIHASKETPVVAVTPVVDSKKLFSDIEEGTTYYFLDSDGDIDWYESAEDSQDEKFYEQANCFTSHEAAGKVGELQLLQREMLRFAEKHNAHIIDWDDLKDKWELNRKGTDEWQVDCWTTHNNPFSVYFNSKEVAEKALETFGDRLKAIYE